MDVLVDSFTIVFSEKLQKKAHIFNFPDIFSTVIFDVYSNGDLFDFHEVSSVGKF